MSTTTIEITSAFRDAADQFIVCLPTGPESELIKLIDGAKSRQVERVIYYLDKNQNSTLMMAAARNLPSLVQRCLDIGSNPNSVNIHGLDAMSWALTHKNEKIVDSLIKAGYKFEINEKSSLIREILSGGNNGDDMAKFRIAKKILLCICENSPGAFRAEHDKALYVISCFNKSDSAGWEDLKNYLAQLLDKSQLEEQIKCSSKDKGKVLKL